MAPFGTIYGGYDNNIRVHRAQIAAAFNKLEVVVAPTFDLTKPRSAEYLAKFPMGKVPAFEGADGYVISEGAAICHYIAGSGPQASQMLGSDPKTTSTIMQWAFFADTELFVQMAIVNGMAVMKYMPFDQKRFDATIAGIERVMKRLEAALKTGENGSNGKFLVGSQGVTYADIMIVPLLLLSMKFVIDRKMREECPSVTAYAKGLLETEEFKSVLTSADFVENRITGPM